MTETRASRNRKNWSQYQDKTKGFIGEKKGEKEKGRTLLCSMYLILKLI